MYLYMHTRLVVLTVHLYYHLLMVLFYYFLYSNLMPFSSSIHVDLLVPFTLISSDVMIFSLSLHNSFHDVCLSYDVCLLYVCVMYARLLIIAKENNYYAIVMSLPSLPPSPQLN